MTLWSLMPKSVTDELPNGLLIGTQVPAIDEDAAASRLAAATVSNNELRIFGILPRNCWRNAIICPSPCQRPGPGSAPSCIRQTPDQGSPLHGSRRIQAAVKRSRYRVPDSSRNARDLHPATMAGYRMLAASIARSDRAPGTRADLRLLP